MLGDANGQSWRKSADDVRRSVRQAKNLNRHCSADSRKSWFKTDTVILLLLTTMHALVTCLLLAFAATLVVSIPVGQETHLSLSVPHREFHKVPSAHMKQCKVSTSAPHCNSSQCVTENGELFPDCCSNCCTCGVVDPSGDNYCWNSAHCDCVLSNSNPNLYCPSWNPQHNATLLLPKGTEANVTSFMHRDEPLASLPANAVIQTIGPGTFDDGVKAYFDLLNGRKGKWPCPPYLDARVYDIEGNRVPNWPIDPSDWEDFYITGVDFEICYGAGECTDYSLTIKEV